MSDRLENVEQEAVTATAEDEGLRRREALFLRRPAAFTPEERRAAIAALLQIDGDSLTPDQPGPGGVSRDSGGPGGVRAD